MRFPSTLPHGEPSSTLPTSAQEKAHRDLSNVLEIASYALAVSASTVQLGPDRLMVYVSLKAWFLDNADRDISVPSYQGDVNTFFISDRGG